MTWIKSVIMVLTLSIPMIIDAQEFNVMSYNIRYDNPNDQENWWGHRKEAVVSLLKTHEPLVFGVQEAVIGQMNYLKEHLTNYDYVGVGRDDGEKAGEFSAVFYNKSQIEMLEEGTFWLSPTPDRVSKAWDAALPRICTYAKFKFKEGGKEFWFFNTHFDHVGVQARDESSKLIIQKIKEISTSNDVIILSGDFNTTPDKAPYANITQYLDDAAKLSDTKPIGPRGTFNGFKIDAELEDRIDYIYTKNLSVLEYKHLEDKRPNGLWVADHLPILARVAIH
ncbi:MAG TPA: endonuclease/exonuclease/phosphatase family protein [Roseivirga sp.]